MAVTVFTGFLSVLTTELVTAKAPVINLNIILLNAPVMLTVEFIIRETNLPTETSTAVTPVTVLPA